MSEKDEAEHNCKDELVAATEQLIRATRRLTRVTYYAVGTSVALIAITVGPLLHK